MSRYLSDQAERTHLLDYLASIYQSMADFSALLMSLEYGRMNEVELERAKHQATTEAMNIIADWKMLLPMLLDIYNDPMGQ